MQKNHEKPHDISGRPLPRGTVTFVFTDIEGSTRLLARLREVTATCWRSTIARCVRAFAEHDGREVHTEGDAFFVAFARATDAIAAAVAAQRALAAHPWPEGVDLRVRMGLHTGEAEVRGDDYVGMDVHRAARICSAAHGGQVLVSSATRELVVAELGAGVALDDLGEHRLKDLDRPERLYQVVADELAAGFPPPRSEAPAPVRAPCRRRPTGRSAATTSARDRRPAPQRRVRLLTLTGPGGVGKTRLALEAARAIEPDFADGACFVSLAAAATAARTSRGDRERARRSSRSPASPPSRRSSASSRAKHLLLVVDNFEHVLGAAPFIGGLLDACPALTVLATSREPLALQAEDATRCHRSPCPSPGTTRDAGGGRRRAVRERARATIPAST